MASASVKTIQFVDPRIEPQPNPMYDYVIGPTQNQFYKLTASSKSNTNITFNNLTTLGVDRAYLDTMELEITAVLKFHVYKRIQDTDDGNKYKNFEDTDGSAIFPTPDMFTFQSFPFNTCCDEARVNINGGAFMTQPMCYVRAKERYMNQYKLSKCYQNVCPVHRPELQTESGRIYNKTWPAAESVAWMDPTKTGCPTRLGPGMMGYMQSSEGMIGGFNNSIINILGSRVTRDGAYTIYRVTWREPIFCSPFSSRYDATYGRPLYNITSMDMSFNLMDLGNMIRLAQIRDSGTNHLFVHDYSVDIENIQLCYQVMTIPAALKKPAVTLVPYRRFVPYITQITAGNNGASSDAIIDPTQPTTVTITSGVYTFNEIPTAIWVFGAPTKNIYQQNIQDTYGDELTTAQGIATNLAKLGNWDSNNLFADIENINISLANTTQILATAQPYDLYRIAKANGCQDSYVGWHGIGTVMPKLPLVYDGSVVGETSVLSQYFRGPGSVLRLKPGVDIILPDTPLIPGANANNMVLQVTAQFTIPEHSANKNTYALWLLFEQVGVAAISPGMCEISMNPVGSGEIMAVSPVVSATSTSTEGKLEGSGFWDKIKTAAKIGQQIGDSGIVSKILRSIPSTKKAGEWMESHGMGEPSSKRQCVSGGAIMGHGLNDWV